MERPIHGGNLAWAAQIASCPVSSLVDFSASINPLGPPKSAIAAIQKGLSALTSYPDPDYTQLRTALSQWHQIPPDWILPGNGSAELLTWASRDLAQQEVAYLMTPAFSDYWRGLKAFSAKVETFPLDLNTQIWNINPKSHPSLPFQKTNSEASSNCPPFPGGIKGGSPFPGGIKGGFQNPKSTGFLLNNPHNPTGKLFTQDEILPYLEEFALVVIDEAFMDFLPPASQQSLINFVPNYPNLVILRSLTKFYSLPGLRLGYAIAHPDRLKRWQNWRDPWSVNILAAMAGEAVIQDTAFQEKTWHWLLPTRKHLFESLSAIPGLQPFESSANFLLVGTDYPSSQLQETLLKNYRLLIRDCLSFPELGDRYFRIAVRTTEENQLLLDSLATILFS